MAGTFRVTLGADYDGVGDGDIVSGDGTPFSTLAFGDIFAGVVGGAPGTVNLVTPSGTVAGFESTVPGTLTPLSGADAGLLLDYTGGTGTAVLVGGGFGDRLVGGGFDDTLAGGAGNDVLIGNDGNDVLESTGGFDTLVGGAGLDTVTFAKSLGGVIATIGSTFGRVIDNSVEILIGSAFGDNLVGAAGDDTILGNGGGDNISGGAGNDLLGAGPEGGNVDGEAGDDVLIASLDGGNLLGGTGNDTASFRDFTSGVTVRLSVGNTVFEMENLSGSSFDDALFGDGGVNILSGTDGDDTLEGGAGGDALNGDAGFDIASYAGSSAAVVVNLASGVSGGDAAGDVLSGVEGAIGSAFDDVLRGEGGANRLTGGAGNDDLIGLAGADTLVGGDGFDVAHYAASGVGVTVSLVAGTVGTGGDAAGDALSGIEALQGSRFADALTGDARRNSIVGEGGADTILGGDGADGLRGDGDDDSLDGGTGRDALDGSAGGDTLLGGLGADALTGGTGADTFLWRTVAESAGSERDRVLDFGVSEGDVLDLSVFGAAYGGNRAFLGGGEASVIWRARRDDAATSVFLDANGDAVADLVLTLTGVTALTRDDFVL